jgi:hypothetical protein
MRQWEWAGGRWMLRLPAIPVWVHFGALVAGLMTYGFGWLMHLFFCICWQIARCRWTEDDPRDTEELIAEELRQ